MIRILHVVGSLNNGGSQAMIMNIYRNIDRSKIQFDFIIDRPKELYFAEEVELLGGKIYVLPTFNMKNIFKYKKSWDDFFKSNPGYQIIHGHVRSTASIYLKVAKNNGLFTIAHSHSTSSGTGISAIIKNILQYQIRYTADYFFACSQLAGKWLFGEKICKGDNYCILKNAINTSEFVYDESKRIEKRKELKIEDKLVVGHVGRFIPPKNHDYLVETFKIIHERNKNTVLLLVGDGDLRKIIEKKVKDLGLSESVIFTGVRSDIPDLLQTMDIFVFPSVYEGLPVTLIEAQANGLKCFASENISREVQVTDLIEFIPLDEKIEIWADKIINNIENITRKNRIFEVADAGYDVKSVANNLYNIYMNMVGGKKKGE